MNYSLLDSIIDFLQSFRSITTVKSWKAWKGETWRLCSVAQR